MNTKDKLTQTMRAALKAGDTIKKTTMRMALAAIKNAEIKQGGPLSEPDVLGILQKEVKSRFETIEGAQQAGRPDLVEEAEAEIAVLKTFLPQPLTGEELTAMVQQAIAETGAASPRDMGRVMKTLMPMVKGRADGKLVSGLVRQALQD